MNRLTYSLLLYLSSPLILLRLLWRSLRAPAYRQRWRERFGLYRGRSPEVTVWLHAVSVGEFIAAIPLIRALKDEVPAGQILVTTMTPTGSARVQDTFGAEIQHCYLPYDLPGAVSRFLRHFNPSMAIVMETEIWPNLFHGCGQQHIPLLLANVRLSQRSLEGYQRWAGQLTAEALRHVQWAGVQSEADQKRLVELGAERQKVAVTGSIKFDLTLPQAIQQQGEQLRKTVAGERPVWIAASTREGEEQYVLEAHQQLLQQVPDLLLILVPRHPERFNSVARQVESAGFELVRRSNDPHPAPPPLSTQTAGIKGREVTAQVYLGDTMGEMLLLYAAADIAYVGGSLVPTGSHNMLEPAALGKPVLFGPHRFNFAEISQLLMDQGAAQEVTSAAELASAIVNLLQQPEKRRRQGQQGRRVVEQNRGALDRLLIGVRKYLSPVSSPCKGED